MSDPFTMELRLCDDRGAVSDAPVEPGSPGTVLDPGLTYRRLHDNLRSRNGNPDTRRPYVGPDYACTGSAHLADLHIRCTSPVHGAPAPAPEGGRAHAAPGLTRRRWARLCVVLARAKLEPDPEPGDLVVEVSWMRRGVDPDAVGWLAAHGRAPENEDGTGPVREIWDVWPLTGAEGLNGVPWQRWENARFLRVPAYVARTAGVKPPDGWHCGVLLG